MKNETKKSIKIASLFISFGLLVALFVFFLLFGKGLQIFMPCILFSVFFILFIIFEKLSFISEHPILKAILGVCSVIAVALIV